MFSTIEIEINDNCNMSCSYCPNATLERKEKGEMTDEVFSTLMNQLKNIGYGGKVGLHFYGEPLLSPNLERRVSEIRESLPESKILIYSNGSLLTLQRLDNLIEAGLNQIVVTKHRESEGKPYPFEEVYSSLNEEKKSYVKFQKWNDINLTNRGGILHELSTQSFPTSPCYIPTNMMVVTLKGNVLPCFEDYNQELEMGNILDEPLEQIWKSEKYESFRKNLRLGLRDKYSICSKCDRTEVLPEGMVAG